VQIEAVIMAIMCSFRNRCDADLQAGVDARLLVAASWAIAFNEQQNDRHSFGRMAASSTALSAPMSHRLV